MYRFLLALCLVLALSSSQLATAQSQVTKKREALNLPPLGNVVDTSLYKWGRELSPEDKMQM